MQSLRPLSTACLFTVTVAAAALAGCAAEPGSASGPGRAPVGETDRDRPRGNVPPGMDRSGGGPASGTIVDPTGAATGSAPPPALAP